MPMREPPGIAGHDELRDRMFSFTGVELVLLAVLVVGALTALVRIALT